MKGGIAVMRKKWQIFLIFLVVLIMITATIADGRIMANNQKNQHFSFNLKRIGVFDGKII